MNYRHAYHAGNFADVFKHIVLVRILEYLKRKDKAFRVIDTHAGAGKYQLNDASMRDHRGNPPEWLNGIGRLLEPNRNSLSAEASTLLAPYFDAVFDQHAPPAQLITYPGSPLIARRCLRKQDRLSAVELHGETASALKQVFAGDFQTRVMALDGWLIANSQLPPKEKRGILLTDPPFEEAADFDRMLQSLIAASRRWSGGIQAYWYPLKHHQRVIDFKKALKESGITDIIAIEIEIAPKTETPSLYGCGMVVRNAPYTLEREMRSILPSLTGILGRDGCGAWRIERLAKES